MGTNLYIVSNLKTSKEEILEKKDWFIQKLNALEIDSTNVKFCFLISIIK